MAFFINLCKNFILNSFLIIITEAIVPGGHPKSPTCGHLKIPHPAAAFKT